MTNAQTEARAIAERLTDYGLTLDPNVVICDRRVVDEAATALAAKGADLEGWKNTATEYAAELHVLRAQLAETRKALERHRSERSYVVGWNDGFAYAASEDLKFPTMLRKMWSGGEVQAWLDEQFAARRAREQGGK